MTEKGFLLFSFLYVIVIGVESVFLFFLHRNKKVLTNRVRDTQKAYENRLKLHLAKYEDALQEREQKIKELEQQLTLLQNDEEKQVLLEMVARLKCEVTILSKEINLIKNRISSEGASLEFDPEELFKIREKNIELEMQLSKLQQDTQEQILLREKLYAKQRQLQKLQEDFAGEQEELQKLRHELKEKMGEIDQLKTERDLLRRQYALLKKQPFS